MAVNMSAFSPEQSTRWLGLGDCGFEASSDPTHLLDSNFFFNAASWSTTDPTLLLTHQRHQQQQHDAGEMQAFAMGLGDNSKVSCDSNMGPADNMGFEASCCQSFSSNTAAAPAETMLAAERMNLHVDLEGGRSIRSRHAVSSSSSSSIDPFSFCGGAGGGGLNASPHSQWTTYQHNMCSLSSDQLYNSCADAWMLPKLVSDRFSDSCCSSDRGQSTSSEEITWMNTSRITNNNSDLSAVPNLQQNRSWGGGGGLMLSSSSPLVPADLVPDEYSSSIAAAANDEVELAAVATTTLDHVRQHPHHGSIAVDVECGAPAPKRRASWMSPGVRTSRKHPHDTMTTTTPDPLLQLQQMSSGLVPMLPRSVLGPFNPHQHPAYTLDGFRNVRRALPSSLQSPPQQTHSSNSSMSARFNSGIYPIMPTLMNPGALVDNSSSSSNNVGSSFGKSFHCFSTGRLPHQQGVAAASPLSTMPAAAAGGMSGGFKEFNLGGGFESQRDNSSDKLMLLSASRKPATSVEPQSVAARHRRKKISERVRVLEKLVPGGNKMDTASMLDEAIEFVKFLQLQVQLLESIGEPEAPPNSSNTAAAPARIGHNVNNSSCGQFYPNSSDKCKIDGSGIIDGGFGSSSYLSRSASLMQQVALAAAAANTIKSTATPPLILSEILQEQLFKRKLCLVSLT